MEGKTVEERMQLLEDKEAIREVCCKYCHYVDTGEWDKLMDECFTEDATVQRPGRAFQGKESIRGFMEGLRYKMMCHSMVNLLAETNGNSATGKSYFLFFGTLPMENATNEIVGAGTCSDEFRKEDGKWKICSRTINFKFINTLQKGWAIEPILNTTKFHAIPNS